MTDSTAIRFWDKVADKYAARQVKDVESYEAMLADVTSRLAASDRVLEIGCGTGSTAAKIGGHVAEWKATDFSPEMVRIAQARPAPPSVRVVQCDASDAFDGAPFDAICAFHVLHLVPDLRAMLSDAMAALKPGGLLISKTYCFADMGVGLRALFPVLRLFGMFPPATSLTEADLRRAILAAGFAIDVQTTFGQNHHSHYIVARKPA